MNQKLRNLVYTAMLMALCCVATLVIKIPTVTGGYLNAGDIVVVLAALLAGPLYGGVAAGFGSGLADVISGYMSYAPGTLVVKGCAAVEVWPPPVRSPATPVRPPSALRAVWRCTLR